MDNISITQIKESERDQLIQLLQEAGLPVSDLPENLDHFFLARKDERVIGSIGLELFLPYALLRSMVVTQGMQGEGIGKLLIKHLLLHASKETAEIEEIFLITENAEQFFKSTGFNTINRAEAPDVIKELPQFKSLCPTSAAVMKRVVNNT